MGDVDIYSKIGELLWSIMPDEAIEIRFIGSIYPEHYSGGSEWTDNSGKIFYFSMENTPYYIEREILSLVLNLNSECNLLWNQYVFSLREDMTYDMKFAYIDEEDSWNGLYMKGISDLTWEEAQEYYIPREIWEERVRLKNSQS